MANKSEYVARSMQKKKDAGMVRKYYWIYVDEVPKVDAYVKKRNESAEKRREKTLQA